VLEDRRLCSGCAMERAFREVRYRGVGFGLRLGLGDLMDVLRGCRV